jgi:hypothetical protein
VRRLGLLLHLARFGLLALLALAACGGASHAPASPAAGSGDSTGSAGSAGSAAEAGGEESETKILDVEAIGPLRFGAGDAEILKLMGPPADQSPPEEEGATGGYYSAWSWPGVTLGMTADKPGGPWKARSIEVAAPSKLATKAGIHVGSTRAEVESKYRPGQMDRHEPESLLVGSPYGGLYFTFKDGLVTSMAVGVFAF